jgi:hypothetical protein
MWVGGQCLVEGWPQLLKSFRRQVSLYSVLGVWYRRLRYACASSVRTFLHIYEVTGESAVLRCKYRQWWWLIVCPGFRYIVSYDFDSVSMGNDLNPKCKQRLLCLWWLVNSHKNYWIQCIPRDGRKMFEKDIWIKLNARCCPVYTCIGLHTPATIPLWVIIETVSSQTQEGILDLGYYDVAICNKNPTSVDCVKDRSSPLCFPRPRSIMSLSLSLPLSGDLWVCSTVFCLRYLTNVV